MMLKNLIVLAALAFVLGWTAHAFSDSLQTVQAEPLTNQVAAKPQNPPSGTLGNQTPEPIPPDFEFEAGGREKPSPTDRFRLEDVHVTASRVTIDGISGRRFETAVFTNTNSMDPLIDEGSQALQIVPLSEKDIAVGDIISYDSGQYGVIIHRVVKIDKDDQGWYAIAKGDNNPVADPFKVRFKQIRRVLVGVLY
jgi:hypothetical protein